METVSKNVKKPGRPQKADKRVVRACVRFTALEYYIIKGKAKEAGIRPSDYIRELSIRGKVLSRLNSEEVQFVRQLIGMSTNINQVAKVCHREGLFEAMQYFERYRNEVDAILQKLKV